MKNNDISYENIIPLEINPTAFLAAFHGGPYGLRSFADRPEDRGGRGRNRTVTAAELEDQDGTLLVELRAENDGEQRGIFFVVNPGGHKDAEITAVAAQFVEADDLPLAQQWDNLMAFPLPPSIIVRTRKSLHGYWLLAGTPDLARFTPLQKALAAHFAGDPVIANPSRVMRLPGFDHHKNEPVAVRCLLFEPQRRYRQTELAAVLNELHPDDPRFGVTGPARKKVPTTKATTTSTTAIARSAVALDQPRGGF